MTSFFLFYNFLNLENNEKRKKLHLNFVFALLSVMNRVLIFRSQNYITFSFIKTNLCLGGNEQQKHDQANLIICNKIF